MQLTLHQPVEGHAAGETVDVPDSRAGWLLAHGYASKPRQDKDFDGANVTDVKADDDPTLAENREAPDEDAPTTDAPTVVQRDDLGSVQDTSGAPVGEFVPGEHTVEEVNAFLTKHPEQAGRVLQLEREKRFGGKQRKGVLEGAEAQSLKVSSRVVKTANELDPDVPKDAKHDEPTGDETLEEVPLDDDQPGDVHHDEPTEETDRVAQERREMQRKATEA